jgi:CDP-diglyceride synthetase
MKKLEIKIPFIYIISILLFLVIVSLIIGKHTQGKNELFELFYTIRFFMTNDIVSIILGILLGIPLPLLIFSVFKKRKDLIKGFLISTLIGSILITILTFS